MTLTRIVNWSHRLVQEVLRPGDLAADLTAGKGGDTLMLAGAVGDAGRVVAFDIQSKALGLAAAKLRSSGLEPTCWPPGRVIPDRPGCYLIQACHSSLSISVKQPLKAVIMNLGYLPGSDPARKTEAGTTVEAVRQSLRLLSQGGRLAVTVYPGHPGGAEEGLAVGDLLRNLAGESWHVLLLEVINQESAPYLLVAEKKR
jgi:hypothetical protein